MTEWSLNGSTQTDGSYSITGLPSGTYKVAVWGLTSDYATQFYPNARHSDLAVPITVTTDNTIENINFSLGIGGKISGTIRDASTTLPIMGQYVNLYHAETGQSMPFRPQTDAQDSTPPPVCLRQLPGFRGRG